MKSENLEVNDSTSAVVQAIELLSDQLKVKETHLRTTAETFAEWVVECIPMEAKLPRHYEVRWVREPGISWPLLFNADGHCLQGCRGLAQAPVEALFKLRDDLSQGWLDELRGWMSERERRLIAAEAVISDINEKTNI